MQLPFMTRVAHAAERIWIVVVNYRTAGLVIECLRSIANQFSDLLRVHVIVVDNASGGASISRLQAGIASEGWCGWVSLHQLDRNIGYAGGNNIGIGFALADALSVQYILLLNPDTILHSAAIQHLMDFMDTHPRVGIVGSGLETADGTVERSAHEAPSPLRELREGAQLGFLDRVLMGDSEMTHTGSACHECDWVSGASFMVRREVFEQIGLLDDNYFLYFEEVDFCFRARQAGWEVWHVPESRVTHFEGSSTGIRNTELRRPKYWFESRRRYFTKHHGIHGLFLADCLWAVGKFSLQLRRVMRLGQGGKRRDPRGFAFDLLTGDLHALFKRSLWAIHFGRRRNRPAGSSASRPTPKRG